MPARKITLTLTRRPDGHYVKKIRGKVRFFGNDGEEQARARLLEYLRLDTRGRDPTPATGQPARRAAATVESVADRFLADKRGKVKGATYDDYTTSIDDFGAAVGPDTFVDDLNPPAFAAVREDWSARLGPWALDRRVQHVRTMFNWALAHRLIDRPPFYGDSFSKTTAGDKRRSARERAREHGERVFTPDELAKILNAVTGTLRGMVLLALNGGMYAQDIANLRRSDVVQRDGVRYIDFVRGKTDATPWTFPLWPETAAELDKVLNRPAPRPGKRDRQARDPADADLIYLTRTGRPYVRENSDGEGGGVNIDAIAQEFEKLIDGLGVKRGGVGFGALRHTHVTAVGDHPDRNAARRVRGHKLEGIEAHYDKLTTARLIAVTDLARSRLLLPYVPDVRASSKCRASGESPRPAPPRKPRRRPPESSSPA